MMSKAAPTRALASGCSISNLCGISPGEPLDRNAFGLGTLGFFAVINGSRERQVVLVASRHVLLARGARRGDPVYVPEFVQRGGARVLHGESLEPVGAIAHEGFEGNHPYRYAGEQPRPYFVDCASARVSSGRALSARVGSGGVAIRGVGRLHPLDAVGGRAPRVRKIGAATGLTTGHVLDAAASVESAAGETRLGNIAIRGAEGFFVEPGDSGALVLDERDRAVGIVWGRDDADPRTAYACHLQPVLDALGVTMLAGGLA
jgi:hypothetical protein